MKDVGVKKFSVAHLPLKWLILLKGHSHKTSISPSSDVPAQRERESVLTHTQTWLLVMENDFFLSNFFKSKIGKKSKLCYVNKIGFFSEEYDWICDSKS